MALTGVCVKNEQVGMQDGLGKSQVPYTRHLVRSKLTYAMIGLSDHLSMEIGPV